MYRQPKETPIDTIARLRAALKQAFAGRNNLGQSHFPNLAEPISIGGRIIPGWVTVHFLPQSPGLYPAWVLGKNQKVDRSADNAIIFLGDLGGSIIRVTPAAGGGLIIKPTIRTRAERNLPQSFLRQQAAG